MSQQEHTKFPLETEADSPLYQFEYCWLAGFKVVTAGSEEIAKGMAYDCKLPINPNQQPRLVFDLNGHGIALSERDKQYDTALRKADIIHADGGFLVTLSKFLNSNPIKERSATTDLIYYCIEEAIRNNLSIYFLGGEEEVNARCVETLKIKYPSLKIAGRQHGYFEEKEESTIINDINLCKTDILFVGLGKPKEQELSVKWQKKLNCRWIITCGGCFNFITGHYLRAPVWMQKSNLEWLFRAFTSKKLFWRYLTTNPTALWNAVTKYHN